MLRELLARVVDHEPPIGSLARNSLRAGVTRRRRRRATSTASSAAAVTALALGVPALAGVFAAATGPRPAAPTAYVAIAAGQTVPLNTATDRAGRAITAGAAIPYYAPTMVAAPNGAAVYVLGQGAHFSPTRVTAIDTTTNAPRPPITVTRQRIAGASIAITPNGRTAYVVGAIGVDGVLTAIDTAANKALRPIKISMYTPLIAVAPDGKMVYVVGAQFHTPSAATALVPIRVSSNTALRPIVLRIDGELATGAVITPDSRTAYVLDSGEGLYNYVTPVNLRTGKGLRFIRIKVPGYAGGIVMSPDGRTVYVLSPGAVTPITTATNAQLTPIRLPASVGDAKRFVITPNGKTLYVLCTEGIIPVRLTTGTALTPIRLSGLPGSNGQVMAVTPNGKTLYVGTLHSLVAISTATNTVRHAYTLGRTRNGSAPRGIVFAR